VPDWPLLQEFIAHWKAVTQYFVEKKGNIQMIDVKYSNNM
jgi:hypothetical protein